MSLQGNVTWDKLMDQNTYLNAGQNTFNQLFRYQDSSPTWVENFIATYQIPTFLHSYVGKTIVGNWTLNTVLRETNGTLVSSPSGYTQIANPKLSNPTNGQYFNTCYQTVSIVNNAPVYTNKVGAGACASASSTPAFQQNPSGFWLATIGSDMESVRFHVHPLLDASLFKSFQLHENYTFEIRGEMLQRCQHTELLEPKQQHRGQLVWFGIRHAGKRPAHPATHRALQLLTQQRLCNLGRPNLN